MSIEKRCWMKIPVSRWQNRLLLKISWFLLVLLVAVLVPAGSGMAESASGSSPMLKVGVIVYGAPFLKSADGFRDGLMAAGYREGADVEYSVHNINKHRDSIPVLVQEFVQYDYDLILAVTTPVAQEVKKATRGRKIPVLFTTVSDPVGSEIVDSLTLQRYLWLSPSSLSRRRLCER